MKRWLPTLVVFVIAIAAMAPMAYSPWQHGDERMEAWSAGYYGGKLARLDFSPVATNLQSDPGWSPYSGWAQTQPMGARFIYALALGLTGAPVPVYAGNDTVVASESVFAMRIAAILCAAVGLALIARRLRWPAVLAIALFLAVPQVREDLSRGWGEGPLLMGFGLAAASYGTRAFPPACGIAATFKLTALGVWPLMFWPGAVGPWRRLRVAGPVLAACLTWSAATPPAWFAGGPPFLATMILYRAKEYAGQSELVGGPFGLFMPTRYLWPFELGFLLAACILASRIWQRLHSAPSKGS